MQRLSVIHRHRVTLLVGVVVAGVVSSCGCTGPRPKLFPVAPVAVEPRSDGSLERLYDLDGDRQADRAEVLDADGTIRSLRYDTNGDGTWNETVTLADIPDHQRRHLIIVLDSIPFSMVRDLRNQGRFRCFEPPSRAVAPFPVMTDPALAEFFGTSPCPGVESAFYDGHVLRDGFDVYLDDLNTTWHPSVDYFMRPFAHAFAYLEPLTWYRHELGRIQTRFLASDKMVFVGYVVGTSALGSQSGRDGHQVGLVELDRFCQHLLFKTRGRVHITLMSDHGHYLGPSQRIPLTQLLNEMGYRAGHTLTNNYDVVVPQFGMVTYAAIHTRVPAQVAGDVVGIEGVELAAYRQDDQVVVLSREGEARIRRSNDSYAYVPVMGDPLRLEPIIDALRERGELDENGFASDAALWEATSDHIYPDVVQRLWRAFDGLVVNTPDVLVAIENGYYSGSQLMTEMLALAGSHGNLRQECSYAFVMSTAAHLPAVSRMADLRGVLQEAGVPVPKQTRSGSEP